MDIDSVLKGHGIGIGGSNLKSPTQFGSTTIPSYSATTTVSISAVDLTKSIVKIYYKNGANTMGITAELTNPTTITLTRYSGYAEAITIYWEVYEFNNVKSLQKGTHSSTGTITVSNYNTSKSMLIWSYYSSGSNDVAIMGKVNSTSIQVYIGYYTKTLWQVIEFN